MAEDKNKSVDNLLNQIEVFENTIKELQKNVEVLKAKVKKNKELYGDDPSKWPSSA